MINNITYNMNTKINDKTDYKIRKEFVSDCKIYIDIYIYLRGGDER